MRLLKAMLIAIFSLVVAACALHQPAAIGAGTIINAADDFGNIVAIRIDFVEPDQEDPQHELLLYHVSTQQPGSSEWTALCQADRQNLSRAIPLAGHWKADGSFVASEQITFACTSGVIGKCVRWGYKPWRSLNGKSLAETHQACVRMARADYCGNGISHTKDGTIISMFDPLGIQKREAQDMPFEAAWSPSGATYIARTRWGELKDLIKECPDKLQGHTALDLGQLNNIQIEERFPESLIFNDSVKGGCIGKIATDGKIEC